MGLSILMQNVALMMFSADLFDVPPMLGGRSFTHLGPFYAKPELSIGFGVAVACTLAMRLHAECDLFGKAVKLQAADWSSGDRLWLLALAGDQRVFPKFLAQLGEKDFQGRQVKMRKRTPEGKVVIQTIGQPA